MCAVSHSGRSVELEVVDIDAAADKEEILAAVLAAIPGDQDDPANRSAIDYYCSSNIMDAEFVDFIGRLEASTRSARCDVIIAGDFNSKSPKWSSPKEDKWGKLLADIR